LAVDERGLAAAMPAECNGTALRGAGMFHGTTFGGAWPRGATVGGGATRRRPGSLLFAGAALVARATLAGRASLVAAAAWPPPLPPTRLAVRHALTLAEVACVRSV
jgi:hypothetical protein